MVSVPWYSNIFGSWSRIFLFFFSHTSLIPFRLLFFLPWDGIYSRVSLSAGRSDKTLPILCANSGVIGRQIENATAFYTFIHLYNFWKEVIIRKKGRGLDSPFATLLLIALPDFVISVVVIVVGCHSKLSFDSMV